jgi:DNA-binding protein HU-beta
MSRAALVDAIRVESPELTLTQAHKALNAVLDAIVYSVQIGNPVVLANFGSFTPKVTIERVCRNPGTGAHVHVPAKVTMRFKPSKALVSE